MAPSLCLRVESVNSNNGVLYYGQRRCKVSVVHRKANGDVLVHDGKRMFMLSAESIVEGLAESQEERSGKQRLVLVKSLYCKLMSGEIDYKFIHKELERHSFLA